MIYEFPLTVTTANTEAAPALDEVKLTHGVINRVEVEFPAGCVGLIHVAIEHMGHQAWPSNPGGSFNSDDHVVSFDDYYVFTTTPYKLKLKGWSEGTSFSHTARIRIGLIPESVAEKLYGSASAAIYEAKRANLLAQLTEIEE